MLKMAVFGPMPRASAAMTASENPGVRSAPRTANRKSRLSCSIHSNGEAELATGLLATGDMHNVLGVSPALGRLLNPSDDAASAPPVAVLSHSYWQRRFGGDARVIGQILRLNTNAVTIVGVTAAAFRGITLA